MCVPAARYATHTAQMHDALAACAQFAPGVVLIELRDEASILDLPDASKTTDDSPAEDAGLIAARCLRSEATTCNLPLVMLYAEDDYFTRAAAASIGVDDYFALDLSSIEICARLDALFWRTEVGRRTAQMVGNQIEINNFMSLLDAIRTDAQHDLSGTLVLVEETNSDFTLELESGKRSIEVAHDFFKLNLRRLDSIAFYGPATLMMYLPRTVIGAARARLAVMRDELGNTGFHHHLHFGMASFPRDGKDTESLVLAAEADLDTARRSNSVFADCVMPTPAQAILAAAEHSKTVLPKSAIIESPPAAASESSTLSSNIIAEDTDSMLITASHTEAQHQTDASQVNNQVVTNEQATTNEVALHQFPAQPNAGRVMLAVSDATRLAQLNSLLRAANYEVRAAFDGKQALDLLRIDKPDVVVIDYALRDISGVEALRRLQHLRTPDAPLPVVMLSDATHAEARDEASQLGAYNITLPCDDNQILDIVRVASDKVNDETN